MKTQLTILLLLYSLFANSQTSSLSMPEFLLGMFNDYNGRDWIPDHKREKHLITSFWCSEKKKAQLFVDSLQTLLSSNSGKIEVNSENGIKIYSYELSSLFGEYYKIKQKPSAWWGGESPQSGEEYAIYESKIVKSKFNSQLKKLSFLIGTIYRYGEFVNIDIVEIRTVNSPNHHKLNKKFIKQLGFEIIEITDCQEGYIPCGRSIKFKIHGKYKGDMVKIKNTLNMIKDDSDDCK